MGKVMKICKPFKNANPKSITQMFSQAHQAVDFAGNYGEDLVAPFNAIVVNVVESIDEQTIDENKDDLRRGYGVKLRSVEEPSLSISFWHNLPIHPVEKGEFILQGTPVGEMGNNGWVESNGKVVDIDLRTIPPFPGTHCHITFGQTNPDGSYTPLDYLKYIDWNIPINYDVATFLRLMFKNILRLLQKPV